MRKIFSLLLFLTSLTFGQSELPVLFDDDEPVYAVALDGSTEYAYQTVQNKIAITEYEYLRPNGGYLPANGDSVKGSWVFDNTLINDVTQDQSARNNDLILAGDSTFLSGSPVRAGNVLTFTGNDWLYLPAASATDFDFGTNLFSIEAWVKTSTIQRQYIVAKHTAADNFLLTIDAYGRATFKVASTGDGSKQILSIDVVADGKWHYIVGTCNPAASVSLYVDGVLEQTATISGYSISIPTEELVIGAIDDAGTDSFIGQIAQVRISKRLMTAQEIENNYYRFNEIGFNSEWAGIGNHSVDTTTTSPQEGTYSGKLISTGVGSTSNCITLPIKQPLVVGDKYLLQIYTKTLYDNAETITLNIGDVSLVLNPTTSYVRGYKHFQATASTNDSIKIYLSQADTVVIDHITIKKKFDYAYMFWFKTATMAADQNIFRNDGSTNEGYYFRLRTSSRVVLAIKDEWGTTTSSTENSVSYSDNVWHLGAFTLDWDGNATAYYDNDTPETVSLNAVGNSRYNVLSPQIRVADASGSLKLNGQLGELQIIRFNDVGSFDPRVYWTRGKGFNSSYDGGEVVLWYRWKGSTDADFLQDYSNNILDLTGANVTQSADQIKIGTKYK